MQTHEKLAQELARRSESEQTARARRLRGSQAILTGMRPDVALAVVELGADLSNIHTRANLRGGISLATDLVAGLPRR